MSYLSESGANWSNHLTRHSAGADLEPVVEQINWEAGDDGDYSSLLGDDSISIESVSSKKRITYQLPGSATGYLLNSDKTRALIARNNTKQYRYSFFANYFIQDLKTNTTVPLLPEQKIDVRYAVWSPK
jgi:dipeptidyl-peptidase-4